MINREYAVAERDSPLILRAETACPALTGSPMSDAICRICLWMEGRRTTPRDSRDFTS